MPIRILSFFFCLALTPLNAFCENGRLPDGRAFRVDSEGNEIVDYIAELEVSIDTLNRQIDTLRGELEQKTVALSNCRTGVSEGLTEKTIDGHKRISTTESVAEQNDLAIQLAALRDEKDIQMLEMRNDLNACRALVTAQLKAQPPSNEMRASMKPGNGNSVFRPKYQSLPVPKVKH